MYAPLKTKKEIYKYNSFKGMSEKIIKFIELCYKNNDKYMEYMNNKKIIPEKLKKYY